jgi:hypothetical protein
MQPRTRRFTIIAQDPGVKNFRGEILRAEVDIPAEDFEPGPSGFRVQVIDYDISTGVHYLPKDYCDNADGAYADPYADRPDEDLLTDPNFHAQNVYAIIMRILARFEFALGRRVSWGFGGHRINVAPHAFADANAFYSKNDRSLLFGYFPSREKIAAAAAASDNGAKKYVFSCLSHDVVAHEATHALLDGLRGRFVTPSSPEQAGFHEGFADVVAILSVFSLRTVVESLICTMGKNGGDTSGSENLIPVKAINREALEDSALFGLADQMGRELQYLRGDALRRSVKSVHKLKDEKDTYLNFEKYPEFEQPHRCGELLAAAMINAFIDVWLKRIEQLRKNNPQLKHLDRFFVAEQGKDAAEQLLTMGIRAIDYTPPTDLKFRDYLCALITSDTEAVPNDEKYGYREILIRSFARYGIKPPATAVNCMWQRAEGDYIYDHTHFDSLLRDENEVYRFLWDNRKEFRLDEDAYTRVQSVRPCLRVGPDGFITRETVAEYVQISSLKACELEQLRPPIGNKLPEDLDVTLYGGGTLIFDEYGRLKYHIYNRLYSQNKQKERLSYLWKYGYLSNTEDYKKNLFSTMHLNRVTSLSNTFLEEF